MRSIDNAMRIVKSYQENAEACRKLAKRMPEEQREHLLEMARNWERMAEERQHSIMEDLEKPLD